MDVDVKEHTTQVMESPPTFAFADPPIPDSLAPLAVPTQFSTSRDEPDVSVRDAAQMPRLPKQKAAREPTRLKEHTEDFAREVQLGSWRD